MNKVLYVMCYSGELGWEAINYVPYINRKCIKSEFKEVHIVVRKGREALYPMGTHFYPINLSTRKSMGNSGVSPPPNKIVKKLKKRFEVVKVKPLPAGCRLAKKREFVKYKADENLLEKWDIPKNAVSLCVRDRTFGQHKNWKAKKWRAICKYLLKKSFVPIVTGDVKAMELDLPHGCMDIRGKTSIADFIAIAQQSLFVVGGSTGTMHIASLSGVPHAVWGSTRIQNRYLGSWNPHNTPVVYLPLGKNFDGEVSQVKDLIEVLLKKI